MVPILIASSQRSGSTRLQMLLSKDKQFQFVPMNNPELTSWYTPEMKSYHFVENGSPCELGWNLSAMSEWNPPFSYVINDLLKFDDIYTKFLDSIEDKTKPLIIKSTDYGVISHLIENYEVKPIFTTRKNILKQINSMMKIGLPHAERMGSSIEATATEENLNMSFEMVKKHNNYVKEHLEIPNVVLEEFNKDPVTRILDVYEYLGYECPQNVLEEAKMNRKY